MNWINTIRSVLGKFWTWLFYDQDFILGVQKVHALIGLQEQTKIHNNFIINNIADKSTLLDVIPVPLYFESVEKIGYSIGEILAGDGSFDDKKTTDEWITYTTANIGSPYMLTDHVLDYNTALFRGIDFDCVADNELLFRVDPRELGLRILKKNTSDGVLHVYYIIWAWYRKDNADKDPISGLIAAGAGKYAAELWKVRHEGATLYNAKALLAKASGSVISDVAGKVEDIWVEQDYRHMLIADKIYSAPVSCSVNKSKGDAVKIGDTLFGDLVFSTKNDDVYSEDYDLPSVPGIPVTTDMGTLIAPNAVYHQLDDENTWAEDTYEPVFQRHKLGLDIRVLPLTGNPDTLEAYQQEMLARAEDVNCPKCELPGSLNPLLYITREVRRGQSCIAVLSADKLQDVSPALTALRENICASAILNVVVKTTAEAEFDALTLQATADIGNGAVATSVTPLEAESSIEVEVWL